MTIRILDDRDLTALVAHLVRHGRESGVDGDVIFRPRSAREPIDEAGLRERLVAAWARGLDEPHWTRTWGAIDGDAIVGHADLHGGRLAAELHRATLGMGIERGARGRGLGKQLLAQLVAWARDRGLAWIDLGVFAHNAPARALYRSIGFVEVGTTVDRFRVDGTQIDDVAMALRL
ncbi:MAG TPA: GNAT family N-acetyltransferase [Kofleriaceae bacterium]|nr:GNAT family N-acetyltransferase [Kofleriaceae bacterium]